MAINQLQYAQRYEKLIAQGVPDEEAMRQAEEFATIKSRPAQEPQRSKSRNNYLARAMAQNWLLRKAKELWYGPKTYLHEGETLEERRKRMVLEKE